MPGPPKEQALRYTVSAAVIATAVSITAFEALMAVAFLILLLTRQRPRIPRIWLPLAIFLLGTLISLAASGHIRDGLPQVRKFYIYLMLFLVTTAFRTVRQIRPTVLLWSLAATVAAVWGLIQFAQKYAASQTSGRPFYNYYVLARITGFTDHWMTFGGQMMIALLLIAAIILFATDRRYAPWLAAATIPISAALIETWTRSQWLAAFAGGVYLIWMWKRWALLLAPPLIAAILFANPFDLRERALSAFSPHGAVDSNAHRAELRSIGWKMIQAHPWLGVGPEQVASEIKNYVAAPMPGEYYGHLENNYIQYAAERGVPTMLALMWMIAWALLDFVRALRRLPPGAEERWVLHAAIAVTIGVLIAGWYSWNLNASYVLAMYLAVLGFGYVPLKS